MPTEAKQGYKPSDRDRATIALAEERIKVQDDARVPYEAQMFYNYAMFLGHQWLLWDKNMNVFRVAKEPSWRVRLVSNRIFDWVKSRVAKIVKSQPKMLVAPATMEDRDRSSAKVGEKIVTAQERQDNMALKRIEWAYWACICGTGWVKAFFNPEAGPLVDPREGETPESMPETTENIDLEAVVKSAKMSIEPFHLGEIQTEVLSPFEVRFDQMASCIEDCRWIGVMRYRSLVDIKAMWPKNADYVASESIRSDNTFEGKLASLGGTYSMNFKPSMQNEEDMQGAYVREIWERASDGHPNGRLYITAGGVLLEDGDNPTPIDKKRTGDLPFCYFRETIKPGSFPGISTVEQLTPLQVEYNKTNSQIVESKNLMARPKIRKPRQAMIHKDALHSEAGEVVLYNAPYTPDYMVPPGLPGYVFNVLERCISDMDHIGSRHEVSQGQIPSGIRSGAAIAYLQEQDDTAIGPSIMEFKMANERWASLVLRLAQRYYKENRTLKIVGENNEFEILEFKGADLNSVDVYIEMGSELPLSRSARQQYILDLARQRMLDPERDRELLFRVLELGSTEELYAEKQGEYTYAKNENRRMQAGEEVQVLDFHNHEVHIAVVNKFRMTDEYRNMSQDGRYIVDRHAEDHRLVYSKMMIEAQLAMQNAQGGGNGKAPQEAGVEGTGEPEPRRTPRTGGRR